MTAAEYKHHNPNGTGMNIVKSEIPQAPTMKIAVFWYVISCHLVEKYPHNGGTYQLYLQG
jgi:hypothetical protein